MKLFYRKSGSGTPLIILHGFFGSSDNWSSIGKIFSEKFSVFLVDQRNHGQSPHSEIFNYKAMSDDLLGFMEEENISEAIILGHSMGGKTAMRFAVDHPERVSKLIVADIGPKAYPVHHGEILDALFSVDLTKIKSRKEAEEQISKKINDAGTRQFLLKNLYWKDKEQLGWRMNLEVLAREIKAVGEALNEDVRFQKPVLFIHGSKSDYINEEDTILIKTIFPQAEIQSIPNAGHWLHADQPAAFVETLIDFVDIS